MATTVVQVVEQLARLAPDFVGDTAEARQLIMALVDQAGYSLREQNEIARALRWADGIGLTGDGTLYGESP